LPVGNACAALAELRHFADPATEFRARYHEQEPDLRDRDAPFRRTVLLPAPATPPGVAAVGGDARAAREAVGTAAHFLLADCCSPLGRWAAAAECEATRAGRAPPPGPARAGQFCQALGLQRLSYPRRQVVRRVATACLQSVVRRWMSKDTGPVQEAAHDW